MSDYPQEPTWWKQFGDDVESHYAGRGRTTLDVDAFRWWSRTGYSIGMGGNPEAVKAKHFAEMDAELGPQTVFPPYPPLAGAPITQPPLAAPANGSESGLLDLGPKYFTNHGQPWPFIGYHAHCLQLAPDVNAVLDFPIAAGFNTVIVIGVHLSPWEIAHGLRLDPRDAGYYERLAALFDTCAARQIRVLFYAFGPGSDTLTAAEQQSHWSQSCATMRGRWNVLAGKGNESNVNGWHEADFSYPDMGGVRVSQGTSGGAVDPNPHYLDFVIYETTQQLQTVRYDNGSGMMQMQDGDFAGPALGNRPLISGEWGMVNDTSPDENGDHRFTDPLFCLEIGRLNGASCAGGALGSTASLVNQVNGPIAAECLRQYARGVKAAFVR